MDLKNVIENRVSQKSYKDQKVERQKIEELLDIAVFAPNHKMRQPWRFIIIDDQKKALKSRFLKKVKPDQEEKIALAFEKMYKAPMVIAFIAPTSLDFDQEIEDIQANAMLIQNFLLLAENEGISTHVKTPAFIKTDRFKEILGVHENEIVTALVMVGYADDKNKAKPRKDATALTTYYK